MKKNPFNLSDAQISSLYCSQGFNSGDYFGIEDFLYLLKEIEIEISQSQDN